MEIYKFNLKIKKGYHYKKVKNIIEESKIFNRNGSKKLKDYKKLDKNNYFN